MIGIGIPNSHNSIERMINLHYLDFV